MTGCGAVISGTMQKVRLTLHRETSGGVIKKKKNLDFLFFLRFAYNIVIKRTNGFVMLRFVLTGHHFPRLSLQKAKSCF